MAQELKSNLQPNINDTLMHCLETSTVWLYIVRSAFTDGFFADPVKPHWCITELVEPLGSTNQSWCGVKLLTMSISTHPVDCVHICHLLRDGTTVGALMAGGIRLWLAHPPLPPTHPLYMTRVILQGL